MTIEDWLWVKFEPNALDILIETGHTYFVFCVEDDLNNMYPFKTMPAAILKHWDNRNLPSGSNYILHLYDESLFELAEDILLLPVRVRI